MRPMSLSMGFYLSMRAAEWRMGRCSGTYRLIPCLSASASASCGATTTHAAAVCLPMDFSWATCAHSILACRSLFSGRFAFRPKHAKQNRNNESLNNVGGMCGEGGMRGRGGSYASTYFSLLSSPMALLYISSYPPTTSNLRISFNLSYSRYFFSFPSSIDLLSEFVTWIFKQAWTPLPKVYYYSYSRESLYRHIIFIDGKS
jgi:hypothetical protein